ncbi:hypothetical protein LCL95_15175 [Bacillus timonensis]|nr:hypothetical protein [Bacillus timonensis]
MKWKNYGLWVSIASISYMVLKDLGYQIDLTRWETYVSAILGIFATLGVISNPEDGKGYFRVKSRGNKRPLQNSSPTINNGTEIQFSDKLEQNQRSETLDHIGQDETIKRPPKEQIGERMPNEK